HPDLHSFPTRRSSDLAPDAGELPADAGGVDDGQQPGAVAGGVFGEALGEVGGPAGVVAGVAVGSVEVQQVDDAGVRADRGGGAGDRKSTRLNSSHVKI